MISPKLCYVVVFLWQVLHGVKISEQNQLKLFYATTNVVGPPCSYQSRRVKKHVTLLSVNQITHGLILIQRSSLPLMLILLANDVELNPGPMTSAEELEHSSIGINNSRKLVRKSLRCLYWNTRSLFSQLVDIPTRETSVLDLIITNIPDNISNIEVIDPYTLKLFSDHKCVLFDLQVTLTPAQKLKRQVYDYRRANFDEMNRNLINIDFEFKSSNNASDINDDWIL